MLQARLCTPIVSELVAGAVAGVVSTFAVHPLDTVRVRMQTSRQRFKSSWHCVRLTVATEGVTALYKGLSMPLASQGLFKAVIFSVYGAVMQQLGIESSSVWPSFAAGVVAGGVNAVFVTPVELVRNVQQVSTQAVEPSARDVFREVVRRDGIARLFSALPVTAVRDGLGLGCYFVAFNCLKTSDTASTLAAGSVAGGAFWLVALPLDCVKNVLQVSPGKYTGFWDCAKQLIKVEGVSVLFRGKSAAFIRGAPSAAITLSTHAYVSQQLRAVGWS